MKLDNTKLSGILKRLRCNCEFPKSLEDAAYGGLMEAVADCPHISIAQAEKSIQALIAEVIGQDEVTKSGARKLGRMGKTVEFITMSARDTLRKEQRQAAKEKGLLP